MISDALHPWEKSNVSGVLLIYVQSVYIYIQVAVSGRGVEWFGGRKYKADLNSLAYTKIKMQYRVECTLP